MLVDAPLGRLNHDLEDKAKKQKGPKRRQKRDQREKGKFCTHILGGFSVMGDLMQKESCALSSELPEYDIQPQ